MNLYALHTGDMIRSIPAHQPIRPSTASDNSERIPDKTKREDGEVRCIRFSNVDRGGEWKRLVMARGGAVEEWCW